jgi:hypothetical protein
MLDIFDLAQQLLYRGRSKNFTRNGYVRKDTKNIFGTALAIATTKLCPGRVVASARGATVCFASNQ